MPRLASPFSNDTRPTAKTNPPPPPPHLASWPRLAQGPCLVNFLNGLLDKVDPALLSPCFPRDQARFGLATNNSTRLPRRLNRYLNPPPPSSFLGDLQSTPSHPSRLTSHRHIRPKLAALKSLLPWAATHTQVSSAQYLSVLFIKASLFSSLLLSLLPLHHTPPPWPSRSTRNLSTTAVRSAARQSTLEPTTTAPAALTARAAHTEAPLRGSAYMAALACPAALGGLRRCRPGPAAEDPPHRSRMET